MSVLFCIEQEWPTQFSPALHDLTYAQTRHVTQNYSKPVEDHHSNVATHAFSESMNAYQVKIDTNDVCFAPFFSLQIDETTDVSQ